MTPKRPKDLLAELAEPLEPGTFGEGAQQARRQILVPSARASQLIGIDAAEQRGEHETEDGDVPNELIYDSDSSSICKTIDE
jgi:hypothetical protein